MNTLAELLDVVVTTLQSSPLCGVVRVLQTGQFSETQFSLKVRAEITTGGELQVRLYRNGEHTDYSYQLIRANEPVVRWDDKEHFPEIPTHPHHFHASSGQVESSTLNGGPSHDLAVVLDYLAALPV